SVVRCVMLASSNPTRPMHLAAPPPWRSNASSPWAPCLLCVTSYCFSHEHSPDVPMLQVNCSPSTAISGGEESHLARRSSQDHRLWYACHVLVHSTIRALCPWKALHWRFNGAEQANRMTRLSMPSM
ncbi:hypothetical protein COCCADRAFT_110618, partial [Bipolaris zeicola 26-R-13]